MAELNNKKGPAPLITTRGRKETDMGNFADSIRKVQANSVAAAAEPPIEYPYRVAAYQLLTRGDFVAGPVQYRLNRTIGRDGWSGHREGPLNHHVNGGASYSGPSLALVLEWTLFPLGPVRVWSEPIRAEDATADCPLGCGASRRTDFIAGTWEGCEHLVCEHDNRVVFIEYRDLVRECESCGQDTDDRVDACWNCGVQR